MFGFSSFILVFYVALLVALSAVAAHRVALAIVARRLKVTVPPPPAEWPSVVVQLPLYNERYVAERLIDAVCQLNYPPERMVVQVLDDSTDDTCAIVAARVAHWSRSGVDIQHIRRANRQAFKAGALAHGLEHTDAELVAIFDADFVPPPDFLQQLVPHFSDPKIGMVQARWGHLNRHGSPVTEAQAMLLDAHFVNEHGGRCVLGSFFNFNGTAGVWRRRCIEEAGGWSGQTLTEDLDLSYRAQLKGWRFLYRPDVEVPAELPADINAFKTQQHRWAKGSTETARILLPVIWRHPELSLRHRLEATFHLAGNFAYPLVLLLVALMPFATAARYDISSLQLTVMDGVLLVGSTGSLITFYWLAERAVGHGGHFWRRLPLTISMGVGLAVNNTRAVVEALLGRRTPFARTPKWGNNKATKVDPAYLLAANWQALVELAIGAYLLGAIGVAAAQGRFLALPFMGLFATGFLVLALGSFRKALLTRLGSAADEALTASPHATRIPEPRQAPAENHG